MFKQEAFMNTASAQAPSAEDIPKEVASKLSIVMFSGTADKFIPLGVLAQAAAAMGTEVNIFVTGFALRGFTKQHQDLPFPTEFAPMASALQKGMQATHVAPWDAMLQEAKDFGAKIYACSMMATVMGLKREDFNDLIDDVVGAATFLHQAEHGQTLFI
jgi:peroxiredoxin family protein